MKKIVIFFLLAVNVLMASACARRQNVDQFYFGAYSEAESLFNRKEYEKAIQRYQAYIDENPSVNLAVIARYYMGKSYAALGRQDEAKALFEKVSRENPELVWANFSQSQLKEMAAAPAAEQSKK